MTLTPDDLVGQFILCKSVSGIPESWSRRNIGAWHLGFHPALPVVEILASDSSVIGWLLGYPISLGGELLSGDVRLPLLPVENGGGEQFETLLYDYSGRFVAIYLTPRTERFYLDPCGSLAAVFCPKQQIVASTTTLIPYVEGCEDKMIPELRIPEEDHYYPFGLTPRRFVERLLPNHYLDLETWQAVRHWPTGEIAANQDVVGSGLDIASILKKNISAVARKHSVNMGLTAGRDTRMLLACARDYIEHIQFYTFAIPHPIAKIDCQIAPKIARRLDLDYVMVPFERATQKDLDAWLYRTGNCVSGFWGYVRTYGRLEPSRPVLIGSAGEIGRSFHWRQGDSETSPVDGEDLLNRRRLPITSEIRSRADRWLEELPVRNTLTIWGLLYIEQMLGCWSGPLGYGLVSSLFYLSPYSSRRILELMLSLPAEYRRNMMLEEDLIGREWPELLDFPFNWPMGLRRYAYAAKWRLDHLCKRLHLPLKGRQHSLHKRQNASD